MSKIDLTAVDDIHMTDKLLSAWLEVFRQATGKFPDAILVTLDQAKKFFLNANEIMTNYKGVPLELQKNADQTSTVIMTIDGILKGMHQTAVTDAASVYRLLENMKEKIKSDQGVTPNVQTS
jgi:hypothetical protein